MPEHEAVCDWCGEKIGVFTSPEDAAFEVARHKWPHDGLGCPGRQAVAT